MGGRTPAAPECHGRSDARGARSRFRQPPVLGHTHPMAWTGEFTATAIAAAVRDGSQSATAAVTESLNRIAERDPEYAPS